MCRFRAELQWVKALRGSHGHLGRPSLAWHSIGGRIIVRHYYSKRGVWLLQGRPGGLRLVAASSAAGASFVAPHQASSMPSVVPPSPHNHNHHQHPISGRWAKVYSTEQKLVDVVTLSKPRWQLCPPCPYIKSNAFQIALWKLTDLPAEPLRPVGSGSISPNFVRYCTYFRRMSYSCVE